MKSAHTILTLLVVVLTSCQSSIEEEQTLPASTANTDILTEDPRVLTLASAQAAYDADPTDETNIIWLGRRLSYLERFDEAIDVFTKGLEIHPESYRLLRHRGHRYISTRQFEKAIDDLTRAATLVKDVPIEIEPDGMPNAAGVPRSNAQFNIYYHLGLAHFLRAEELEAFRAYEKCMAYSNNDDLRCATLHWLCMTLWHIGMDDHAAIMLDRFPAEPEIIENDGYFMLIQLYRGERDVDAILSAIDLNAMSVEDVTVGYGLVNWLYRIGRVDEATAWRDAMLRSPHEFAFGFIAAEADGRFAEAK